MKKTTAVLLAMILLCLTTAACAEQDTWTCISCGKQSMGEHSCEWCNAARPAAERTIITFGRYEQDNIEENGPEPIEWIVLDEQDGKYLLISKFGLDTLAYNTEHCDITWEECSARDWLNNIFYYDSFTEAERACILETTVDNSDAQKYAEYKGSGGNDTLDRIFLLSWQEAGRYLPGDDERTCAPTDYALANHAFLYVGYVYIKSYGRQTGYWWLRSPGNRQDSVSYVMPTGRRNYEDPHYNDFIIRPAMWVDLRDYTP